MRLIPGLRSARDRLAAAVARARPDASEFVRQRDEVLTRTTTPESRARHQVAVLWAAQANTIPAAFWTLVHLLHDRAALDEVRAEVRTHGISDLKKLVKLQSSVSEALRLSSHSLITRNVVRDFKLTVNGGREYSLRTGDWVALCLSVLHRDPEIYPDPDRFRFDRFLSEDGPKQFMRRGRKVPLPLLPYGGGVSMCPGRNTANNEIMQFIGLALTHLGIKLESHRLPTLDLRRGTLGILSPRERVPCRVSRT